MNKIKKLLINNQFVKISEIVLLFMIAFGFIKIFAPFAGDNIVYKQVVIWFANILVLFYVWGGIKIRGQTLASFGITFGKISIRESIRVVLISLLVFAVTVIAFMIGATIMVNISGVPENPDMSNYEFLQNNIGMLILALVGSYIVASFGEEVIYRGFLINRFIELGLNNKFGRIIAVIISAIIFGLAHYQWGPMGIAQTTFMGLSLGFFYLKLKKRIWILVLAHAYMDTILMIQMYLSSN
jgi:membrane protease YdiL (CAAX protease family)